MSDLETTVWQRYRDEGLIMYAVNIGRGDNDDLVRSFFAQFGVTFPMLWDHIAYWRQFERSDDTISAFPIEVLIGRDGVLKLVRRRYVPEVLTAAIEAALEEAPP